MGRDASGDEIVRIKNASDIGGGDGTIVDGVSSSIKATVKDYTNSNPLMVGISDASGDLITSFGGGTQYTEGDTDATITGTALLWEDGSNTLRPASAAKPLPVEIIAGGGSGGTSAADDADFTATTTAGTPAMGVYESAPTSVTDGDLGTVGITVNRRLKTSSTIDAALPAGTNNIGDIDVLSSALPTGASTLAEQQSQTTHLATIAGDTTDIETAVELIDDAIVADDAAFTPATTKVMMAGFEFDDVAPDSVNEGDAGAARMSANRNIYTTLRDAAGNERGANIDASNQLSVVDSAVKTAVEIMDDWDESDRAKVNLIVGQAGVQGGSGTVSTTTQRVVLATDVALPAGTNAIGKLAANSGVDIGDVDITSIAAGDNNIGNVDIASALPAGTNNIGDVDILSIIPGTGATNLGKAVDSVPGATDTGIALLAVRDDALTTLTPADGDYTHLRVSSTGALHVTGSAGTTQYAEDAAHASGDSVVVMGAVRRDTAAVGSGTDGDYSTVNVDGSGRVYTNVTPSTYATDDSAMPATPVVVPVGGEYRSSATTYTDGDATVLQTDANGNLKVTNATLAGGEDLTNNVQAVIQKPVASATYSPSLYSEITQVTKANIKASAGNVMAIYCSNDNAAVRYFQLHNKASAPAATEVPIYSIKVPAGTANNPGVLVLGTEFFTTAGRFFSTGIGWAISTTYGTFTDSGTNTEHIAYVHYI